MRIHASCAARDGDAVLVTGPSGSGKSDLVLRLLDIGFILVADDQVLVEHGLARAPNALQGLLEVRGLGIVCVPYLAQAPLRLHVRLAPAGATQRLPPQAQAHDLPIVVIDPAQPSAPARVGVALRCAIGQLTQHAGTFAA